MPPAFFLCVTTTAQPAAAALGRVRLAWRCGGPGVPAGGGATSTCPPRPFSGHCRSLLCVLLFCWFVFLFSRGHPAGGPVKRRPDLVLVSHLLACSLCHVPDLIYNSACFACMFCGWGGAGLLAVTLWPLVARCNRNRNRNPSLHKASSSRHTRRVRLRSRVRGPGGAGSHGGRSAAWVAAAAATRSCTNSKRHTRLSRLRSRDMGPCGGSAAAAASCAPGGGCHGTPMCGHKTAQQQRRAGHVLQTQHAQHDLQGAAHRLGTGQPNTGLCKG